MRRISVANVHAISVLALAGPADAEELDEARFTRCVMTHYQIAQGLPSGKLTQAEVRSNT